MQEILGWGFRLMRYYKNAVPTGELNAIVTQSAAEPIVSERQAEIAQTVKNLDLKVGQHVKATVTDIEERNKGRKVTYHILVTQQNLTNPKEYHPKAKLLVQGQQVIVEILELKEDGSIKKVKLVDLL